MITKISPNLFFRPFLKILSVGITLFFLSLNAIGAEKIEVTDSRIANAVEDELLLDGNVLGYRINAVSNDGVVTLSGIVDNILAKERAVRIAETVKGVRAVINKIQVSPHGDISDEDLKDAVETALLLDPAAESYEIDVKVDDQLVTLSGTVDSFQEKELAVKEVQAVKGVKKINNKITVDIDSTRLDSEIKAEIEKALLWSALIDAGLVEVHVQDGNVRLTGVVGSLSEKTQAEIISYVAGVRNVDASGLKVKKWARDSEMRKKKYDAKSDEMILDAVRDSLIYDPRVMSFDITPEVMNGFVTLRGTVDNLKAKKAAASDARNVVGVVGVKNRIQVEPAAEGEKKNSEKLIEKAFLRDPYLESYEIDIAVINGIAKLSGLVDTFYERARAEEVASGVEGVIVVDNNLSVLNTNDRFYYEPYVTEIYPKDYAWFYQSPVYPRKSDLRIKNDIKSELFWSPFVDENEVKVEVDKGTASLTGSVDSWLEYYSAEENAYEGGAVFVDNDLMVADLRS